ncbi:unnamed protein product [Rhizoctonia solani]|uniref:Uncharacterized protein n=1 Tax=Rhizoctonia solani TaxID=456999 RepID=A0A8H3D058_9AGAM|nr:unnamed protein product [Rhizoctonia solani]
MKSRQPVPVLRSSRIRASRQKSDPTTIKTNAVTMTESISTPREPSPVPPQPEKSLDSLTSGSQQSKDEQHRTSPTLEESFASQMSLDELPSTAHNAEPTTDFRRRHNTITYKRLRTMRMGSSPVASGRQFASPATIPSSALSRSAPLSQPLPGSIPFSQAAPSSPPGQSEPDLVPSQPVPNLLILSQPDPDLDPAPSQPIPLSQSSSFHGTQSSAPSCSPVPAHVSHRSKRRRRLPPLKNRLAKVARSRPPRQSPAPQPEQSRPAEDSEYGEEEIVRDEEEETKPTPVNVTQRRLAAPENFTIPDLKDLLGYKSQAQPPRTPAPRFVLPQNTIRAPRLTQGSKSPVKRKAAHTPRLKFVALEAHREQATTRSGNTTMRLPTPQASPVRKFVFPRKDETEDPVQTFSNRQPQPSPSRVLVKATPELEEPVPKLPSLVGVMSTRLTPEPEVEAQPNRSLAPMSELYDNLMKLAKSAHQMGRPPVTPELSSLKRKLQTTLTPQVTFEVTQSAKVARLQ